VYRGDDLFLLLFFYFFAFFALFSFGLILAVSIFFVLMFSDALGIAIA